MKERAAFSVLSPIGIVCGIVSLAACWATSGLTLPGPLAQLNWWQLAMMSGSAAVLLGAFGVVSGDKGLGGLGMALGMAGVASALWVVIA